MTTVQIRLKPTFDINKPYRTRDGREAQAFAVPGGFTLTGWIVPPDGSAAEVNVWSANGAHLSYSRDADLVNTPAKHVRWVNIHAPYEFESFETKEAADANPQMHISGGLRNRIACIRIEFEEGEGL